MPLRPLIGLVGSRFTGDRIVGNLEVLAASPIDVFYADYATAVIEAGGLPMWIPVDVDPADAIERLDGLLMTGGTDIAPERYGAVRSDAVLEVNEVRDQFELSTLDAAEAAAIPTLGICRGLQMMNVHAGGTLHQHVPEEAFLDLGGAALTQDVSLAEGSVLADVYGPTHRINSLHHQQAAEIGDGLRVTARTPRGGVEGIEHEELPWVGVQWHPEMLPTRSTDPIFAWLVNRARGA